MKKFVAIALTIITICSISSVGAITSDIYAKVGIITKIDYEHDTITIVDIDGHVWLWDGCEDWDTYDLVCFILSDHGTEETREDDEIISMTYNGYVEPDEACFFWGISKG